MLTSTGPGGSERTDVLRRAESSDPYSHGKGKAGGHGHPTELLPNHWRGWSPTEAQATGQIGTCMFSIQILVVFAFYDCGRLNDFSSW